MVPVGGMVPLQSPEAAQVFALAAFHCSVTDLPMGTGFSLAFNVTDGGAAAAGPAGLLVSGPVVSALELEPHATSELSAINPSVDFNANANLELRLRRIELITLLPRFTAANFLRSWISFARNH